MMALTNTFLVDEGALFQPCDRVMEGRFNGSQAAAV